VRAPLSIVEPAVTLSEELAPLNAYPPQTLP
jgi:hypothetical protein